MAGKVVFAGKTVVSGSVLVQGKDGIIKATPIQEGTYAVLDLPAGPVRVVVNSPDPGTVSVTMRKPTDAPPPRPARDRWFPLPERYAEWKTTPLQFELKRGRNEIDLHLE